MTTKTSSVVLIPAEQAIEIEHLRVQNPELYSWLEGFEEIHIYGVNLAIGDEYFYEKPCAEWWIGKLEGEGKLLRTQRRCGGAHDAADQESHRDEERHRTAGPAELQTPAPDARAARARNQAPPDTSERAATDRLFDVAERELGEEQCEAEAKDEHGSAAPSDVDPRTRHHEDGPMPQVDAVRPASYPPQRLPPEDRVQSRLGVDRRCDKDDRSQRHDLDTGAIRERGKSPWFRPAPTRPTGNSRWCAISRPRSA